MSKRQRKDLTFKHNLKHGRHGWLRLTPAYSIKLVHEILDTIPKPNYILDPFCGTGTTGLVSGELSISCDLLDINPFLVWFATAKTNNYTANTIQSVQHSSERIADMLLVNPLDLDELWVPPIRNITRWWDSENLSVLAQIQFGIKNFYPEDSPERDLLLISFCRLLIESSNASFNHQSMSFNNGQQKRLFADNERRFMAHRFIELVDETVNGAKQVIPGNVNILLEDARNVPRPKKIKYDCVITSPPYPNRMSYIRELRPYMYWLGYLVEAREAGDLDWKAIGGTWGIATSRLKDWKPNGVSIDYDGFSTIVSSIRKESDLLSSYVHKYFVDAALHINSLYDSLAPDARIFYIVGNSKFYNTLVPTEKVYANLMRHAGFEDVSIEVVRKRNSKKELYEFCVSATKPK